MKNSLKFLFLFMIAAVTFSCSNDDDNGTTTTATETIADFVAGNQDYTSLLAALERADLVNTLDGTTQFTVFAPNNAAFDAFLAANGFATLEDVPVDLLRNVLLNHVVSGAVQSGDLSTGYFNSNAVFGTTSLNLSLFIDTTSGVRINGVATVTSADNNVDNGVIHLVDAVIGIPTIVTQATANPDFSTLVDALVAATDGTVDYVALLSDTSSTFTVFAPNNAAFAALLDVLGVTSVNDLPQDILQSVLNYHVIAGANVQSGDLTNGPVTTFQGEDIIVSVDNGPQIIDATGNPTNVIAADVQTGNGVVHAIDMVLLPEEVLDVIDPTISDLAMMTPSLSTLNEALGITGLNVVLDNRDADFTVFAPTNDAFDTFLNGTPLADVPVDALTQIVLNHALTGTFFSSDLTTGYVNSLATYGTTDNPLNMYINLDSGVLINGVSNVILDSANIEAANGVVHVVDAVIDLPTVVTFATADSTFETLVAALTRPDQAANNYVEVLSTPNGTDPAPFTVFAPTNQAFANLLSELNLNSLDDIDGATLTATLNTHVIAGANVRADDLVDGPVSTLGDDIVIDATNATITDPNGRVIQIEITDVQAANGVVHVVSTVILPQL